MVDPNKLSEFVDSFWDEKIVPTLFDYIKIPNKSPHFDADWEKNGHMEEALQLAVKWIEENPIPGAKLHIGRIEGRTPVILVDVPGDIDRTVVMYGHLDKQPEMEGWREGLGPWKPVMENDKLYGRGGADDGYALFASVCALKALKEQGVKHARIVLLIEFSEESGSIDLPYHVDNFADIIGEPELVICLDSGAGNYDQLWSTTSLRGVICGTVRVDVLREGVHSGDASGIVPSSFRVMRQLLDRLECSKTGKLIPEGLYVEIPDQRQEQITKSAEALGEEAYSKFPFVAGVKPWEENPKEMITNRTWRPALSYTGQTGMPDVAVAGNVLRPYTTFKLSLRLPPTLDAKQAQKILNETFTKDVPYNAKVTVNFQDAANGWNAPALAPWLDRVLNQVSNTYYGKPAVHMGEGGSIPFMGMLNAKFPNAQFVVTGVLGPLSNAHGPNEFLHIPYAKKLTCCVSEILEEHAKR